MSNVAQKWPFVSIIIVNYNGRHLMDDCLGSLQKIDYPQNKHEVIVVDNDSHDDSVIYIRKKYPWVNLIISKKNTGFTGGNNLGLEHVNKKYQHAVLLNSDTRVERKWLKELVKTAQSESQIGLVSSKLLYATPFIELTIDSDTIRRSEMTDGTDHSPVGVMLEEIKCRTPEMESQVWYQSGFYEKQEGDIVTRWTDGQAQVLIPFVHEQEEYQFTIHGYNTSSYVNNFKIRLGEENLVYDEIGTNQVKQYNISISKKKAKEKFIWLVQNSGNQVLRDGYGKDRGSTITIEQDERIEFYERDSEYFNQERKLEAVCGASLLIKRKLIEDIKMLDGYYFMYYEDLDLSFRAWRAGWDIAYSPKSIVFHKHRASTGKTLTPFFLKMTERNHLFFLTTHFPLLTVMMGVVKFIVRLTFNWLVTVALRFSQNIYHYYLWQSRLEARWEAATSYVQSLPRLWKNRLYWSRKQVRDINELISGLY